MLLCSCHYVVMSLVWTRLKWLRVLTWQYWPFKVKVMENEENHYGQEMICVINRKQKKKTHWTNWSIREIRPCSVRDGDENFFCSSSDNWASLPPVDDTFTTLQKKKKLHEHHFNPMYKDKQKPAQIPPREPARETCTVQFKWQESKHSSTTNTRKTEKFWSCYWPCY